jgi:hypothetical protein
VGLAREHRRVSIAEPVPQRDERGRLPRLMTAEQERELRKAHYVTPSNMNPWFGKWVEGSEFTVQQQNELIDRGLDPAKVDRMVVLVKVTAREWSWNPLDPAPVRQIVCPIIGKQLDRIKVIAPHGERKLVYPGGHLTRPKPARGGRYAR